MSQENYYNTCQRSQRTEKGKQHEMKRYKRNKDERQGEATEEII